MTVSHGTTEARPQHCVSWYFPYGDAGIECPRHLDIINPPLPSAIKGDPAPTEHQEACWLVQWYQARPELRQAVVAHVTNEGTASKGRGGMKRGEGLLAGYPDYLLDQARAGWLGLRIELKRVRGSSMSEDQRDIQRRLLEAGYLSVVACGWRVAAAWMCWFISRSQRFDCRPHTRRLPERLDCMALGGLGTYVVSGIDSRLDLAPTLIGERGARR